MLEGIKETGTVNGAASQMLGEVTGGIVLGIAGDKGLSKVGTLAKVAGKVDDIVPKAGNLGNPFKGKTLEQVQQGFEKQAAAGKLEPKHTGPVSGSKSYVNSKSGYSYNVDTGKNGKTGLQVEKPHVDVKLPESKAYKSSI